MTVLGVAGIGKSRLAQELVDSVSDRAVSFSGRCLAYGEGITLWPLTQIVPNALRLAEGVGALDDDPDASLIRGRLAELSTPAAAVGNEETFWAVRKLFEAIARTSPLVVMFEDIHWAEPKFIDLIEYLAGWTRDVPLMLLCVARPDLVEKHPSWTAGRDGFDARRRWNRSPTPTRRRSSPTSRRISGSGRRSGSGSRRPPRATRFSSSRWSP